MPGLALTSLAQTTVLADKMLENANILAENEPILCSCFVPCKLNKEWYICSYPKMALRTKVASTNVIISLNCGTLLISVAFCET